MKNLTDSIFNPASCFANVTSYGKAESYTNGYCIGNLIILTLSVILTV